MIYLALFALGVSYTIMIYVRNKQRDRLRQRRERLEERQEELLESLRKRDEDPREPE